MDNYDELWHCLPQLSLRHGFPRKPPNLSATKQKKPRLATEAEEKRWKTFDGHETNLRSVIFFVSFLLKCQKCP